MGLSVRRRQSWRGAVLSVGHTPTSVAYADERGHGSHPSSPIHLRCGRLCRQRVVGSSRRADRLAVRTMSRYLGLARSLSSSGRAPRWSRQERVSCSSKCQMAVAGNRSRFRPDDRVRHGRDRGGLRQRWPPAIIHLAAGRGGCQCERHPPRPRAQPGPPFHDYPRSYLYMYGGGSDAYIHLCATDVANVRFVGTAAAAAIGIVVGTPLLGWLGGIVVWVGIGLFQAGDGSIDMYLPETSSISHYGWTYYNYNGPYHGWYYHNPSWSSWYRYATRQSNGLHYYEYLSYS